MSIGIKSRPKRRSSQLQTVTPQLHRGEPLQPVASVSLRRIVAARSRPHAGAAPHVIRWLLGLAIASGAVVGLSPYFLTTLRIYQWSDQIGDYVLKEGYVHRDRDEGWASTHYGPWGLASGVNAGRPGQSTVLIWGDSYVEAHQINDEEKVAAQLNRVLSLSDSPPVQAVSVGHSYWSVADYYYHMPGYDKLLNPAYHFIVLAEHGLKDLCPDEESFLSRPEHAFVQRALVDPRRNSTMERLTQWHLADLSLAPWKAVRTLAEDVHNLRFMVGPRDRQTPPSVAVYDCSDIAGEPDEVVASWAFAIDRLKAATGKPIVLVLVPEVPYLQHGAVHLENLQVRWTARLAELCRTKHVDLIDMTDVLVGDYLASGMLSRGFNNGRPGLGHLNARGHALLAQQIQAYLESHRGCN
jgi:hypothetical protein